MVLYLVLHKHPSPAVCCLHQAYVDTLPPRSAMRTPLWFNPAEVQLLQGTNLAGAVTDRQRDWQLEWMTVLRRAGQSGLFKASFEETWPSALWAATILSSRAFPSHLIDGNEQASTPVLFPGVDAFNHQQARKVTWQTSSASGRFNLVQDEPTAAGQQVFNNYGPKSNEEFLLGYGFIIPNNPDDHMVLKLAPPRLAPGHAEPKRSLESVLQACQLTELRHLVRRDGVIPDALLAQVRLMISLHDAEDGRTLEGRLQTQSASAGEYISLDNELNMIEQIMTLLYLRINALSQDVSAMIVEDSQEDLVKRARTDEPAARDQTAAAPIRPEVLAMVMEYRKGQLEIAQAATLFCHTFLLERAAKSAQAQGIDVTLEDLQDSVKMQA
ncbi:uncharacterized protein L969DRAFT_88387 [Mixia osmundae IAM 14324]|nr:uncharacterized protein L969DRAFT_88387 [Mixia osmundae IAM 14324]KEI38998.1 hypothetical protein L969DRAFT_88387 [Mixia osmundae IAM 14324]